MIGQLRPDVIHAHDPHGVAMAGMALSFGAASRWKQGRRAPALIASRRVDFHLKANSFSRWKYRQVDCFIAASDAIRSMLIGDGVPADRAVTVHEGIDVDRIDAVPIVNVHEAFWLPHHAPLVGNVAALVPHKGQRYLIEAAHRVVQKIPDARFVILGEGELRDHLEHLVREHHLEKHVLLPGFRVDVIGCIKGFDLFAMSSVTEGLGTSLLDAMACRTAIVGTRAGGIPEVVEDGRTGVLVEPRDPNQLAGAIIRLIEDGPLRSRMAAAGLRASARTIHGGADGGRNSGRLRSPGARPASGRHSRHHRGEWIARRAGVNPSRAASACGAGPETRRASGTGSSPTARDASR